MRLEHLHRRIEGGVCFGKKKATGGVAVETVHRLKRRYMELLPENHLYRLRIATAQETCGLIGHNVVRRFKDHSHMTGGSRAGRRRSGLLLRSGTVASRLALCGADHSTRHLDGVTRVKHVSRDPNALAVHPHAATVDDRLGRTTGKPAPCRKKVLQRLVVLRLAHQQLFNVSWNSSHYGVELYQIRSKLPPSASCYRYTGEASRSCTWLR